jgi:uncharacterized DUF497 family protein
MNYEWDTGKYRKNIKKHKVTFEQAAQAIEDPCSLFIFDEKHSLKEDRYIVIGSAEGLVLFVNEIEIDENTIRIISARLAKTHEKEAYYENCSLFFGKQTKTQ